MWIFRVMFEIPENAFSPAFWKRTQYSGDKEIRAMAYHCNTVVKQINKFEDFASSADEAEVGLAGISFDVDLDTLIHEVWIGPNTSEWVIAIVRELMSVANIADKRIQISDI